MRKLILAAAALTGIALTPAAHAEPLCWAWVSKGDSLVCELRGPSISQRIDSGFFVKDAPRPTAETYSQTTTRFGTLYSQTRYYGGR